MQLDLKPKYPLLLGMLAGSLFLAGCSSWTGLAAERYDHQKIERDEEAIEAFTERQEIVGSTKALYLDETYSKELTLPSLDYQEGEEIYVHTATYEVGKHLPASRYMMAVSGTDTSRGTIRLEDKEGHLIVEEYMDEFMGVPYLYADLREGDRLIVSGGGGSGFYLSSEGKSMDYFDLENYFMEIGVIRKPQADQLSLRTGIWEVGKHLEAGTYQIVDQPTEGFLYLFEEDQEEPMIIQFNGQNVFDAATQRFTSTGRPITLDLKTGQKLSVQGVTQIFLEKE